MARACGHVSTTNHPSVQQLVAASEFDHDPKGAPSFDFAKDLLPMLDAILVMPRWNFLYRLMVVTMFLLACCLMFRALEVTSCCPRREHIKLPSDDKDWAPDGLPYYLNVGLLHTKGKRMGDVYYMRVYRNLVEPRLCPVFYLLWWLSASGIKEGPIFVRFYQGKPGSFNEFKTMETAKSKMDIAYDSLGRVISLVEVQWRNTLRRVFIAVFMPHLIPHSLRKSGIKWAARCHAQDYEIRLNSRHSPNSNTLCVYIEGGMIESDEATIDALGCIILDPIFFLWCWRPVTVHGSSRRSREQ